MLHLSFYKPKLQATAEANNLTAVAAAKDLYTQLMEDVCGGTKPYLSTGHLDAEHLRVKDKALFQVNNFTHKHCLNVIFSTFTS